MKDIKKYSICSLDKNSWEETCMYLWVEKMGKEGKIRKNIVGFDVNDAIKMVDDKKKYNFEQSDTNHCT